MMSNPKGLKNIPAIRQNVAMFLRNICLQVITIHLFGFKVYEFENELQKIKGIEVKKMEFTM